MNKPTINFYANVKNPTQVMHKYATSTLYFNNLKCLNTRCIGFPIDFIAVFNITVVLLQTGKSSPDNEPPIRSENIGLTNTLPPH